MSIDTSPGAGQSKTAAANASDSTPDVQQSEAPGAATFAERLRAVEAAAREWGIHPHHPEGKFVAALLGAIGWLGELHEAGMRRLEAAGAERAAVARMQLDAAIELRRHAEAALHQARTAMIQEEVIRENLVVRMIDQTFPMFAERLQKCLVIKEWVYNTRARQRRFFIAGGITLAIFLGGYVMRVVNEFEPSQSASTSEVDSLGDWCAKHVFQSAGHTYCLLDEFTTPQQ
jgi:hypothetical protein